METHRNRDRLSTLIQKLWSVQKSTRPFQSIKVLNTYSKAQRNQWESGHWIQQALEHTHTGRQGVFTCRASCRKLWANSSIFWRCHPTAAWEPGGEQCRGSKPGYPALGIATSGTAQHWSSSALLDPFFSSFTWALVVQQIGNPLHPTPESRCAGWTTAPGRSYMEEPRSIHPYRWAFLTCGLLAIFFRFSCLFVQIVSASMQW